MGMTDNLSPSDRKKTMAAVKGKGTKLERKLWSMLAGMHLRDWRKNPAGISGNPDVIFPERRVAIFVDGCFWHRCPTCNRPLPQANREYWESKLNRNVELGAVHQMVLSQEGWQVVRIWEHEFKTSSSRREVRAKIRALLLMGKELHEST